MTGSDAAVPPAPDPKLYWERRAQQFAGRGDGLAAVCAYGMPEYYNRVIHWCQYLALRPWLEAATGAQVLDAGCGIGRWCGQLARHGASVTGVDLSPTMVAEARHRAHADGLGSRCRFVCQDLADLALPERFDLILGVTVLQHILDPLRLRLAVQRLVAHLAPAGRLVLLEAAPRERVVECNTPVFRARTRQTYLRLFADCGLDLAALSGVDPAPFRRWIVPRLAPLPRPLALAAAAAATALSAPLDLLVGRRAVGRSWHLVFVLERTARGAHGKA